MKTTNIMAATAILLLLSCQKMKRTAVEEPTLNLTAPSGQPIAANAKQLKEMTANMLVEKFNVQQAVTITGIDYLPVKQGYAATISFQLADGMKGSYGILSSHYLKRLTPALPAVQIENGDLQSKTYMLVCTGPCQCRAFMAYNYSTNTLYWSCGCEACDGAISSY
jgi:hypothetical protein